MRPDAFGAGVAVAPSVSIADEDSVRSRLHARSAEQDVAQFDGAERTGSQLKWFFFGANVASLEAALLQALRSELACRGAWLRITGNGAGGPWRETKIRIESSARWSSPPVRRSGQHHLARIALSSRELQ